MRRFVALAAVGAAAFVNASVAQDSGLRTVVRLADYDETYDVVVGRDTSLTEIPLGYFKRVESTVHLPGLITPNYPPNPCIAHTRVWNQVLETVPEGQGQANALLSVLSGLARRNCAVEIVFEGDPSVTATILSIRPLP